MSITIPKITGFVTRAQAGLRPPRSISKNIDAKNGGVALHYGGSNVPTSGHDSCISRWKSWQNYHMDGHGWVDIAYSMGVCQHGYAFAGRGAGVRTAANGTNYGNSTHYAVCWIGGAQQTPTPEALSAIAWCINALRSGGNAGRSVKPHRFFKATGCPGNILAKEAGVVDGQVIHEQKVVVETKDEWEVFWMSLTDKEKAVLKDFAAAIEQEGTNAGSFVKQLLAFHRTERPRLREFLEAIDFMGSSPRGQGRALSAMWREAGARGWLRDIKRFQENRVYTENDLN